MDELLVDNLALLICQFKADKVTEKWVTLYVLEIIKASA